MWPKAKAAFRRSVTILWARIVALSGVVLMSCTELIADDNINGAVKSILDPKYVPFYIIAIGLITELCRRRTVGKATDECNRVVPKS